MSEKCEFGIHPMTCHAFNSNRQELATSLNDYEVKLYKKQAGKWQITGTLKEHDKRVTGIDWAPKSNRIVTCGADRNAYVWTHENGSWRPELVLLRINRAATFVRWSPKENKFAVGSSARIISVCYYDVENTWWVSKHIRKPIRSTVTCLDWHPNNILLAAGSADFKARVFSAYVKDIEEKPSPCTWGSKLPFQALLAEYSNGGGGWVHSVSFSASGDKLAWVGHDSSISIIDAVNGQQLSVLKGTFLPLTSITWITENTMAAVGYDCCPKVFTHDASRGEVTFVHDLDIPVEKDTATISAMSRFHNLDKRAQVDEGMATTLETQHQNTITQVSVYDGTKANCNKISTSGVDGNLIIWDLRTLERTMAGLRIT